MQTSDVDAQNHISRQTHKYNFRWRNVVEPLIHKLQQPLGTLNPSDWHPERYSTELLPQSFYLFHMDVPRDTQPSYIPLPAREVLNRALIIYYCPRDTPPSPNHIHQPERYSTELLSCLTSINTYPVLVSNLLLHNNSKVVLVHSTTVLQESHLCIYNDN